MLHLFNYGNSSDNTGFDFDNSTIAASTYSKMPDKCGMLFYGPASSSQFVRLKKTNNTGKKYIEFMFGNDFYIYNAVTKIVFLLHSSSIPMGAAVSSEQQFRFILHGATFYRGEKPIGTLSYNDINIYANIVFHIVSLAIDFDLGHIYVGQVSIVHGPEFKSVEWFNDPVSGIPTYTFAPNTELCIDVNPYYQNAGGAARSFINVFENELTRRINAPSGYSYWNSSYSPNLKTTFRNDNFTHVDYGVSSKTSASEFLCTLPWVFPRYSREKIYYEIIVTGDIRSITIRQSNMIYGRYGNVYISKNGNNTNMNVSVERVAQGDSVTNTSTLYSNISSDITGTNVLMVAVDYTSGIPTNFKFGFNGNWILDSWITSIMNGNAHRSFLGFHSFNFGAGTCTLKSKTGEFTYAPPSGYIGLDDSF